LFLRELAKIKKRKNTKGKEKKRKRPSTSEISVGDMLLEEGKKIKK
jgi:hypothetical protein